MKSWAKILLTSAFLFSTLPAFAETKGIDFSQAIKGPDGNPITNCPEAKPDCGQLLDLTAVAVNALFGIYTDARGQPEQLSGEEKFRRSALAFRIKESADPKNIVLAPEELSLLKDLIAKAYAPIVVYRAWKLIDPSLANK